MKKIQLTQGQVALVDDEDHTKINQYKWRAQWDPDIQNFYAIRSTGSNTNRKTILMHRQIAGTPPGQKTDHRNHNTLDNRKTNLRICSNAENQMNQRKQSGCSSKYKGVHWDKQQKEWRASIQNNRKKYYLGHFDNEVDAARAYNVAAVKKFGEYALLNNV